MEYRIRFSTDEQGTERVVDVDASSEKEAAQIVSDKFSKHYKNFEIVDVEADMDFEDDDEVEYMTDEDEEGGERYEHEDEYADGGMMADGGDVNKLKENIIKALFLDNKGIITEAALMYDKSPYSVGNITKQDIRYVVSQINSTKKYNRIIIFNNSYGVLSLKVDTKMNNGKAEFLPVKMADGGMFPDVITFPEFKQNLPSEMKSPYWGESGSIYKPKFDSYSGKTKYFKGGRRNSDSFSLADAYDHYLYDTYNINFKNLPSDEKKRLFGSEAKYYKLKEGGKIDVYEAEEYIGSDEWNKMTFEEKIAITDYLIKTGQIEEEEFPEEEMDIETLAAMQYYRKGGRTSKGKMGKSLGYMAAGGEIEDKALKIDYSYLKDEIDRTENRVRKGLISIGEGERKLDKLKSNLKADIKEVSKNKSARELEILYFKICSKYDLDFDSVQDEYDNSDD